MPSTVTNKLKTYQLKLALPLKKVPQLRNWLQSKCGQSSNWEIENYKGSLFNWRTIAGAIKSKKPESELPVTVLVTLYDPNHLLVFVKVWPAELVVKGQC